MLHCYVSLVDQELCAAFLSMSGLTLYTLRPEALPYGVGDGPSAFVKLGCRLLGPNMFQTETGIVFDCTVIRHPHENVLEAVLNWTVFRPAEPAAARPCVARSSALFAADGATSGALGQEHGEAVWKYPLPGRMSPILEGAAEGLLELWLMFTDWNGLFTLQRLGRMDEDDGFRELVLIDIRRSSDGVCATRRARTRGRSRRHDVDAPLTQEDTRYCALPCPEGVDVRSITSLALDATMGVVYLQEGRILHRLSYA
jgi:hypothetical protein